MAAQKQRRGPGGNGSSPPLSDAQQQAVAAAAAEYVRAAVCDQSPTLPDPTLGGAASLDLAGAFVSLKRAGMLRSCCGLFGQTVRLVQALQEAAGRTAKEDIRFPPVSATELPHLDMEVWLLFRPELVRAEGEQRVKEVTVGKHGLQVVRGQARGLLLPGVPVEHHWDARQFLEQVCIKAGLHPSLWKDPQTRLYRFEGLAIKARVVEPEQAAALPQPPPPFSSEQVAAYRQFCRGNIQAILNRATPNYYFFGAPDANVNGLAVTVGSKAGGEPVTATRVSLRPGLPLQSTLYGLAQSIGNALARQGARAQDLESLSIDLTILYDPAMHGTVAEPDLRGLEPAQRAVMVTERNRSGWVYDPKLSGEELVGQASELAQVQRPSWAFVYSLAALSTAERVCVSSVPRPVRGPESRPPGVAGSFYPADPDELQRLVDQMLGEPGQPQPWKAAMVPHAGLIYSGRLAASVLKRLQFPDTVLILAPKHTAAGVDWAVAPHRFWAMPGFSIESAPGLARKLAEAIPELELDALAHQREHAIEVQLPFIARLAPQTKVVGITIARGDLESCSRFAQGMAEVIEGLEPRPLLLISSDMNHFATDAETRKLDELALAALERLDPKALFDTVSDNHISMCGLLPAVIVLETLKRLGELHKAERVGYATTADTTGDPSRVVGYAGMLFA